MTGTFSGLPEGTLVTVGGIAFPITYSGGDGNDVVLARLTAVNLSVSIGSGTEAASTVITVTATADQTVIGNQTVDIAAAGTGITAADFALSNTTITILNGATTGSVTFTIQDDNVVELPTETATLTISNPSAGIVLGTTTTQNVDITDDDTATFLIDDVTVNENAGTLDFTVSVDKPIDIPIDVDVTFSDVTATGGGTDFTPTALQANFAANDTVAKTISVPINDDAIPEAPETFTATLSTATALGGRTVTAADTGTGTITDNDPNTVNLSISSSIASLNAFESLGKPITITATADVPVIGAQTVDVNIAGTVNLTTDYTLSGTTITIPNGATSASVTLVAIDDNIVELTSKSVDVSIVNPSAGIVLGATTMQSFGLFDDDAAVFTFDDVTVNEGAGTITFTLSLSSQVDTAFDMAMSFIDGTTDPGDFDHSAQIVSYAAFDNADRGLGTILDNDNSVSLFVSGGTGTEAAGSTITVRATADAPVFVPETVTLTVTGTAVNGTDYTLSGTVITIPVGMTTGTVTLTVLDDNIVELVVKKVTLTVTGTSPGIVPGTTLIRNVNIIDDDKAVFLVDDVTVNENAGTLDFTVSLSNPVDITFTMIAQFTNVTTALADFDHTPINFNYPLLDTSNKTISVPITDDGITELTETFNLLTTNSAGGPLGTRMKDFSDFGTGTGTILDNDLNDFGDAPTAAQSGFSTDYLVLLVVDGARHVPTGPQLGTARDAELNGQPTAGATGDANDEEADGGVSLLSGSVYYSTSSTAGTSLLVNLQNSVGANNRLDGWVDFNQDGDWDDAGEQILTQFALGTVNGNIAVPVVVPALTGAPAGASYMRLRLSTGADGALAPTGPASDGEVHDQQVTLQNVAGSNVTFALPPGGGTAKLAAAGGDLVLTRGTTQLLRIPNNGSVNQLTVTGTAADDDTLEIDVTAGAPNLAVSPGIIFDGNESAGDNDTLMIKTSGTVIYDATSLGAGTTMTGGADVSFVNLEPIDFTGSTITSLVLNVDPADNTGPQVETRLQNAAALGFSEITLSEGLEDALFPNPGDSLTINGDPVDGDLIAIDSLDPAFAADLTIDAQGGGDTIEVNTDLNLTVDSSLSLAGESIVVDAASIATSGSGNLTFTGDISLTQTLTLAGQNIDLNGSVSGAAGLVLAPTGTATLAAGHASTFTSTTTLLSGLTLVDGELDASGGPITVGAAASLGGSGTIQRTIIVSGTITPNGIQTTGDISFGTGSTLAIDLGGAGPGLHDQLAVDGTITLAGGVNLNVATVGSFVPGADNTFIIVDNDAAEAVIGTFAGLPEGTLVTIGGRQFSITYSGGDGNDVVLRPQLDFGDAPTAVLAADGPFVSDYPVTWADNGARHDAVGPKLGHNRDAEPNGVPSAAANGDDLNMVPDDEDGVSVVRELIAFPGAASSGQIDVNLQNPDASSNRLDAWIDFNQDGDWNDPGEQIFTNFDLGTTAGTQTLNFTMPAGTVAGDTYGRFRLSTSGGLSTTGLAADGEVEDHVISIFGLDFNFLKNAAATASDFRPVLNTSVYSAAAGFGWISTTAIETFDAGVGTPNDLQRDFHFLRSGSRTFRVDLPDGNYDVSIYVGSAIHTFKKAGVIIDGTQVDQITTTRGMFVTPSYPVTVTGGKLELTIQRQGGTFVGINGLKITAAVPPGNPVVTTTTTAQSYTANDPATAIDPGLTLTDADSTNLTGATVRFTAGHVPAEDVLEFTDQLGITGSFVAATGLLTLTGTASVADYQTAVQSVAYRNSAATPTVQPRKIQFEVTDGVDTGSATRDVLLFDPALVFNGNFDFVKTAAATATGFTTVLTTTAYNPVDGFGWLDTTAIERFDTGSGNPDELRRDYHFLRTGSRTFRVDVPDGDYAVTINFGSASHLLHNAGVIIDGRQVDQVSTTAGEFKNPEYAVATTGGKLELTIERQGGTFVAIAGLSIVSVPPPPPAAISERLSLDQLFSLKDDDEVSLFDVL